MSNESPPTTARDLGSTHSGDAAETDAADRPLDEVDGVPNSLIDDDRNLPGDQPIDDDVPSRTSAQHDD